MWLVFSLGAAFFFGCRGILYHWTSQKPMNRNLMLCGVFATGALVNLALTFIFQHEWTASVLIGLLMGTFSFGASASMYKGFAVGKASIITILTGLPPVVVVILAYFLYGEKLSGLQLAAFLIIISGVVMIRYSNDISLKNLQGVQWGVLAMLCFGLNDITAKYSTLLEADLFPTAFFMFAMGATYFYGWWLFDRFKARNQPLTPDRNADSSIWSNKKTFSWGMCVGLTNTFGMIMILTAFDLGVTGLVSAVTAANILIILLYTRVFTKEKFTRLELLGIAATFSGILVLRFFS